MLCSLPSSVAIEVTSADASPELPLEALYEDVLVDTTSDAGAETAAMSA